MGFIYEDNTTAYPTLQPTLGGPKTGLLDNLKAATKLHDITEASNSRRNQMREAWQPIVDTINKKTNAGFKNPYEQDSEFDITNPRRSSQPYADPVWGYNSIKAKEDEIFQFVKNNSDTLPEYQSLSEQSLYKQIRAKQEAAAQEQADIADRQTFMGAVGEFAGGAWSAIKDPINLGVTGVDFAVGGGKAKVAEKVTTSILRLAFRDAVINAGSEALIQTEVADWYKKLDLPYDYKTFLTNVGFAGAGGFVLRGGLESAAPLYRLSKQQLASGIEAVNKAKAKMTGMPYEEDAAIKSIKTSADIEDFVDSQNIIPDDVGNLEHNRLLEESAKYIEEGNSLKALTGKDITEIEMPAKPAEDDLQLFDGVESSGYKEQSDALIAELNDAIQTRGEGFLDESIPMDRFDPNTGETVQSAMTVREMLQEAEQDKMMIDRLTGCLT